MSSSRSETDILTKTVITLKEEINELRTRLDECVNIMVNQLQVSIPSTSVLHNSTWSDNQYVLTKND